jgi:hypothetical protein
MVIRVTKQGCKVETTYVIQPNGQYREEITLSVDPASSLALAVEERGQNLARPVLKRGPWGDPRRYRK